MKFTLLLHPDGDAAGIGLGPSLASPYMFEAQWNEFCNTDEPVNLTLCVHKDQGQQIRYWQNEDYSIVFSYDCGSQTPHAAAATMGELLHAFATNRDPAERDISQFEGVFHSALSSMLAFNDNPSAGAIPMGELDLPDAHRFNPKRPLAPYEPWDQIEHQLIGEIGNAPPAYEEILHQDVWNEVIDTPPSLRVLNADTHDDTPSRYNF